jgi:flagellar motor switch protein FliM
MTEAENTAHPSGAPLDPFAVDFFGRTGTAAAAPHSEEHALSSDTEPKSKKRINARKRSDWYKNLPRFTNTEAEFSNLLAGLPENLTESAAKIIAGTLARYSLKSAENADCSVISVTEVNLNQALQGLTGSPKVFLKIGCQTENSPAIGILDIEFASALIDAMLEGNGADTGNRRELSPIETTIIEFIGANVIGAINDLLGEPLLFLQTVKNERTADFESPERGAEIILSVGAENLKGVVSLFVPHRFLRALDKTQNPLFTKKALRKKLGAFERFAPELDLRPQIGTTFLDADSLLYLEPDDIVLIEQPAANLRNENFSGSLQVLVGRGTNFRLRGFAENNQLSDGLNFRVEEILSEEARRRFKPAKFKMDEREMDLAEEKTFENDPDAPETSGEGVPDESISPALENVQVALRVEIAGGKISLRELQDLRAGQIIALGAGPTDPVRLVTDNNDEPVATGELVEIEGQLGVRLTKVFI